MKRVDAKIVANQKEDPAAGPDQDLDTWLFEAKLGEDILGWETVQLNFRSSEVGTEILESNMSAPNRCSVRTRGKSPLKEGDVIHVDIREQQEN